MAENRFRHESTGGNLKYRVNQFVIFLPFLILTHKKNRKEFSGPKKRNRVMIEKNNSTEYLRPSVVCVYLTGSHHSYLPVTDSFPNNLRLPNLESLNFLNIFFRSFKGALCALLMFQKIISF